MSALFLLILALQSAPPSPTSCIEGASTTSLKIRCLQAQTPKGSLPDACAALESWQKQPKTANQGPLTAELETSCTEQKRLRLADRILKQGRPADALAVYESLKASKWSDLAETAYERSLRSNELKGLFQLPLPKVLALEREGKFDAAYDLALSVSAESDPHRKSLAAFIGSTKASRALEERKENEAALKLFADFVKLATLDPLRDRYLIDDADQQIVRLTQKVREDTDRKAASLIEAGDVQMARGKFPEAVTTYDLILQKSSEISPHLVQEATRKATDARVESARQPSFYALWLNYKFTWHRIGITLAAFGSYLTFSIPVLLIVGLLRRRQRKEVLLSLQDTSTASVQNNQNLSDQMRREMELPVPTKDLRIDTPGEADGSSLGQLSLRVALRDLETAFQSDAIKFAGFSINPIQLLTQFSAFCRPRYRFELEGTLIDWGTEKVCTVTLVSGQLDNRATSWQSIASGENARDTAVRDTAMKILIDLDATTRNITKSWRSLSRLRAGIRFMGRATDEPRDRKALLERARDSFQESVLEDPKNWLSRFNLGIALRRLGLDALAADQFAELERLPQLPPTYQQVVRYNRAAALQRTGESRLAVRAIHILDEILKDPELDDLIRHLAQSGRLAAKTVRLCRSNWRLGDDVSPVVMKHLEKAAHRLLSEGRAQHRAAEKASAEDGGTNGSEYNVVLAVFLNALGQLEGLIGHAKTARTYYRRSLTLQPTFVDAALNLAELYMRNESPLDENWAVRAQRLLLDVQNIDAGNTKCLLLLGTLYANPVFGKLDEAQTLLRSALPAPDVGLRLGQILLAEGKPAEAVGYLVAAARQRNSSTANRLLLVECVLALPANHRQKCDLLAKARSELRLIAQRNETAAWKPDADRLLPLVEKALEICTTPQPAPPATTA